MRLLGLTAIPQIEIVGACQTSMVSLAQDADRPGGGQLRAIF
jgi:hypothetical protein